MTRQQSAPDLYKSTQHRCPYLLDRTAANLLVDPRFDVTPALYDSLIDNGFRRNGTLYYRPHCPQCDQCRSVRIPVQEFKFNRSQQRAMKRNAAVTTELRTARFTEEHFSLYRRYQSDRHTGDSMDDPDPGKYKQFLINSNIDTFILELRIGRRLLSVSVMDHVANGLSAVYTFYDPDESHRSPGIFSILKQIELARSIEYDWLYLGYWIKDCQKMSYKSCFRPLEAFNPEANTWITVD